MKKTKEELREEYKKLMKQFTVVIEGYLTEEQEQTNEKVEPRLVEIEKELEEMNEMKNYFQVKLEKTGKRTQRATKKEEKQQQMGSM